MTTGDLHYRAGSLFKERRYAEVAEVLGGLHLADLRQDPELGVWLSDAWRRLGRTREALDLVRALADASQDSGIPRLELERLNLEGIVRYEIGDLGGAETSWSILHALSLEAEDHQFVARANNNLGIIFTLQARPLEAVTAYERAVSAYRVTGWQRGIAQAHLNLAITYRDLGHYGDAAEHFEAAVRYATRDGSQDEIARAESEQALLAYSATGDATAARRTIRSAMRSFAGLQDPLGFADAVRVLAMIELSENQLDAAIGHAQHALEHARNAGHRLMQGEALVIFAAAAQEAGDQIAADAASAEAFVLFHELQAPLWGLSFRDRVGALAARASRAAAPAPPQSEAVAAQPDA